MEYRYNVTKITVSLALLGGCCVLQSAWANEDDLLGGDLHALMAETVTTVVSRTAESIVKAPARVTVFTRQDIQDLGVQNLFDLLEYTGSFANLVKFHDVVTHAEGLSSNSFMIYRDGILLRDPLEQRYVSDPPYIDLGNVDRVEIMHGSGSVLYGQGAAAGVIQIITRRNQNYVAAGAGSHNRQRLVGNFHHKTEKGLALNLGVQAQQDKGHLFDNLTSVWGYTAPVALIKEGRDRQQGPYELDLQADYKSWTFNVGLRRAKGEGGIMGPVEGLSLDNFSEHNEQWFRAQYELPDFSGWSGKVAATHKSHQRHTLDLGYPGAFTGVLYDFIGFDHKREVTESKLEAHLTRTLNERHSFQVGFEAQRVRLKKFDTVGLGDSQAPASNPDLIIPNVELPDGLSTRQGHVYVQHKAQWNPKFSTTTGGRYMHHALEGTNNDKSSGETSYRVAASYQPTPQHNLKLVHNKSFDVFDLFHAIDNPYSFSQIRSTELIYEFSSPKLLLSLGVDRKKYTQSRDFALASGEIDRSTETFKTTVAEVGATLRANQHLQLTLNASKPVSSSSTNTDSYFNSHQPDYMASAALTYRKKPYTANLSLTTRGGFDPSEARLGEVGYKNELHANVRYDLSKKATLVVTGRNLTDEVTGHAELVGNSGSLFQPSGRGREYYVGVEYEW